MDQAPFSAFEAAGSVSDMPMRRRAFDVRMQPVYIGLAIAWTILLVTLPLVHLSLDIGLTAAFLAVCGVFLWTAACLRLRGLAAIAMAVEAWTLLSVVCLAGVIGTYIVARYPAPYADDVMVAADRMIAPGLGRRDTLLALVHHPLLLQIANHAYGSLKWQSGMLILLLCATGQTDRCAAFLLRWMITLALVVAIFTWFPCDGPNAYYHISHAAFPGIASNAGWCAPKIIAWLRSTGQLHLDPSMLDGIVTFPSFHAAGATLFAWGFWTIRWVRWPMLVLNIAMIAATGPIGGHYYIDVVAGIAIALTSIALPQWYVWLRSWFRSSELASYRRCLSA